MLYMKENLDSQHSDLHVKHKPGIRPTSFLDLPTEIRLYIYSLVDERYLFHHYHKKLDQSLAATLVAPMSKPLHEGSYHPNTLLKMLKVCRRTRQEIVTEVFDGGHFNEWLSSQKYCLSWPDAVLCFPHPAEVWPFLKTHRNFAAKARTVEVYCGKGPPDGFFGSRWDDCSMLRKVCLIRVKSQPLPTLSMGFGYHAGRVIIREIWVHKDEYLCLWV